MNAAVEHRQRDHHAEPEMEFRDICALLANELERVRVLGLRVEGAICAIAIQSLVDDRVVAELQNLDAMLQQVAALRDYAGALSSACPPSARAHVGSALDRITLAEVRARLSGEDGDFTEEGWEVL